jgi:hypothetical protein
MQVPKFEVAQIIEQFGEQFIQEYQPNSFTLRVLDSIRKCKTSELGGHKYECDCCVKEINCYNSCKNRHCPKCQATKQAFWVEDRIEQALDVKHFHIVFTIPDKLNEICLLDSKWFYNILFECVWDTLRTFGYSHYAAESGAICVLHTWGQTLSFHPHIHCIVPAAGITLKGNIKLISKNGKYLYPVRMLSAVFRGKLLEKIKRHLKKEKLLHEYQNLLNQLWIKPWNVHCETPMGNPEQIVKYLGQYTHRIAISNQRIKKIDESDVEFYYKDYSDNSKRKIIKLSGVEFLRRFSMNILPKRFVKIRYYGIYSSKSKTLLAKTKKLKPKETTQERLLRLTGFDVYMCPFCKKGRMVMTETLPKIRSPTNPLYRNKIYN